MTTVTVYGMTMSGNCHKVRLLLDHLKQPYEWVEVDLAGGENRGESFLARNPCGQVPVLELSDGRCLPESGAILLYLAEGTHLLPDENWRRAQVFRWLFFEQSAHEPQLSTAHFIRRFLPGDHPRQAELTRLYERGCQALSVMECALAGSAYITGEQPSVADFALYGYTHRAGQAGFDLNVFPAVKGWIARLESNLGLRPMPG